MKYIYLTNIQIFDDPVLKCRSSIRLARTIHYAETLRIGGWFLCENGFEIFCLFETLALTLAFPIINVYCPYKLSEEEKENLAQDFTEWYVRKYL